MQGRRCVRQQCRVERTVAPFPVHPVTSVRVQAHHSRKRVKHHHSLLQDSVGDASSLKSTALPFQKMPGASNQLQQTIS